MQHSLLGEFWLDDSSGCFKADSFGLAGVSVFAEGDSVLLLSSPVFSSELALLSSLSAAFSCTDAGSAVEVCWGIKKTDKKHPGVQTAGGGGKWGRGQSDKLKGVQVWQKSLLRVTSVVEVWGTGRRWIMEEKKDSPPALTVSCYLGQLSPCPQRRLWETQSSLQARRRQLIFFSLSETFSEHDFYLRTDTLFWPGGIGVPGCVATGLAGTGVLGSEDKLSVSFFSSMPIGIRSGELSFPFTCSNSWTYIKQICSNVNKWKSQSFMVASLPQVFRKSFIVKSVFR